MLSNIKYHYWYRCMNCEKLFCLNPPGLDRREPHVCDTIFEPNGDRHTTIGIGELVKIEIVDMVRKK